MPFYKDTDGCLHFIDSADFQSFIPAGSVEISDGEAESLCAISSVTTEQKILALEATVTPRRIREAIISGDSSFINGIEQQISALRVLIKQGGV